MKKTIRRFDLIAIILFFVTMSNIVRAQDEIAYQVRFPNVMHHEAEISFLVPKVNAGPLTVRMARASTGRYATHEFGKNVYDVKAFDETGKALKVSRTMGDVFKIEQPSKSVKITYTLYGNWVDGTYAGFDRDYAQMNMAATFMYPVGYDKVPRTLQLDYADRTNWSAVTQLKPLGNNKYWAKDFQYFMDSPVQAGELKTSSFEVSNADGSKQNVHLVTNAIDAQPVVDNFTKMIKRMVEEQKEVFGEYPSFDYGHFYFMQNVNKQNAGDGMEHRNSTVIVETDDKIEGNEADMLSTFSHEFFHAWNVERLRPSTLEPFKFEHSNVTDGLWFAEGFTQYYGSLLLTRAGFRNLNQTTATLRSIVNTALTSPGALNYSPIESSEYAVFADAAAFVDETNKNNIFASYYIYGASVALALDLRLRSDYNLTLDDYMRALWLKHGKTEKAFTMMDLQIVLADLTKNPKFAENFFQKFVHGTEKEDYKSLLLNAGFVLERNNPGRPFTGFGRLNFSSGKAVIAANTLKTSPAYKAGINIRNVISKINNQEIKSQQDIDKILSGLKPGDQLNIDFEQRGKTYQTVLTLGEDPSYNLSPIETKNQPLTKEAEDFRNRWLNTKVK